MITVPREHERSVVHCIRTLFGLSNGKSSGN